MKRTEPKPRRVMASNIYAITLYVDEKVLEVAREIEAIPEIHKLRRARTAYNQIQGEHYVTGNMERTEEIAQEKVTEIYRKNGIRTNAQREAIDDVCTMLRLGEKYGRRK